MNQNLQDASFSIKKQNLKASFNSAYKTLSPEKVLIVWGLLLISLFLIISSVIVFSTKYLITVPTYGGTIKEGLLGTPRFINPVLATTEQDKDLTNLIFAGLTKVQGNGEVINDLAQSISVSEDGLKYIVELKPSSKFHDGEKVTADDIIFTINLIQNPTIKSPRRIEWEGVAVQKINNTTVEFSLKQPFPQFNQVLQVGILPKHIWKSLTDEQFSLSNFNINAIGSGPFKLSEVKTQSGIPVEFILESNKDYTLGRPFLSSIIIKSYQNEKNLIQGFNNKEVDRVHGLSSGVVKNLNSSNISMYTALLPRSFVVFLNPNKNQILADKEVRAALNLSINKTDIINKTIDGHGKPLSQPFPFSESTSSPYDPNKAKEILAEDKNFRKSSSTIRLNIATANTEEMKSIATQIKQYWEAIGIPTSISVYEISDLNQSIIKDRDFEVLLFGTITQNPSDLYAFWHSSQRNYPGLNVSNYVSKELDSNLEILRNEVNPEARKEAYDKIVTELNEENPGIFLFSPELLYISRDKIISPIGNFVQDGSSRFQHVREWYKYDERVFPRSYSFYITQIMQNLLH